MTKKLLTMASALVLAIGVSAFASGDDNKACADKQCGSQCSARAAQCADAGCCDPFDGLNLTPEQMMRLNTITTECRDAQKAAKCCKEGKADCCKKAQADSCAARQRMRQHNMRMRGAAANAEATSEYLAKVKEVLTPEQYVQFLENCVTRGATMPRMFDRPGGVKYRDPKTGRAIPTGRDGRILQRPRPALADSCATASAPSCCSKK